jgi:hypothetical protein
VEKPEPQRSAAEHDKPEETDVMLIEAGGDPTLFLEMADEALNARPQSMKRLAD